MSRITIPVLDATPAEPRAILDAVGRQAGFVPNMFRLISASPAVLAGMAGLSGALSKTLDVKTRERIALAVAEVNGCEYCLAAHTHLALSMAKMTPEEVALNRKGGSSDPKAGAVVRFAAKVAETRGNVSDADLQAVKGAGFSEEVVPVLRTGG